MWRCVDLLARAGLDVWLAYASGGAEAVGQHALTDRRPELTGLLT